MIACVNANKDKKLYITFNHETCWQYGTNIARKIPTGRFEAWHFFPDDSYLMETGDTPLEAISKLITRVMKRKGDK